MASIGGIKAGEAFIVIEAIDKTSVVLNAVANKVKRIGAQITQVGAKLMQFSAIGMIPFAAGSKVFVTFDDAMRRVEARSSGTADEMKALRDQAKQLGRETSYTATQVGELQSKLAQKGFDRSQIKAMTGDIVNLAKAAGEGTEEDTVLAADLVSGTLRAFKMESSQAGRLSDIFTTAVNNSNFSLEGLMDAMSKAAPIASDFKMSVEETVAALASMTNLNIAASDAGTAMKTFFLRMSDPGFTQGFNKQLQDATGKTIQFRDAAGNLRSPLELFKEIGNAMEGMGTATRGELFSQLFGVLQAGKASGAVSGMTDAFELLNKLQKESQGSAKKTADAMESGLGGSFRKLMSAIEGVGLAIGEAIAGPLMEFIDILQPIAQKMAEWIKENDTLVASIAVGLGVLFAAGATLAAFGIALGGIGTLIGVVASAFAFLATSTGTVLVAIAGFTAGILAYTGNLYSELSNVWRTIQSIFGQIVDVASKTIQGIADAFAGNDLNLAWEIMTTGLELTFSKMTIGMMNTWTSFLAEMVNALSRTKGLMANAFTDVGSAWETVWAVGDVMSRLDYDNTDQLNEELMKKFADIESRNRDAKSGIDKEVQQEIERRNKQAEATMQKRFDDIQLKKDELNSQLKAAEVSKILEGSAPQGAYGLGDLNSMMKNGMDEFDAILAGAATQRAYGFSDLSTQSASGALPAMMAGNFQRDSVDSIKEFIKANQEGGDTSKQILNALGVGNQNTQRIADAVENLNGFDSLENA